MSTEPALNPGYQMSGENAESYGDLLARSEHAIDELREKFPDWSRSYVDEMHALSATFPGADPKAMLKTMHNVAHNLKGMGASFGYPLVSDAGQSLCFYLRSVEDTGNADRQVIDAILKCLDVILDHKIAGDGGEIGRKLIARLQQIAEKAGTTVG